MTSGEGEVSIKKGQVLGSISSVVKLPEQQDEPPEAATPADMIQQLSFPELSSGEAEQVTEMLQKCQHVFSSGDSDIGLASVTEHHIQLHDDTPIYQHPRRCPQPIAEK